MAAFRPDVVVLATGARPRPVTVPGAPRVHSVWDALLAPDALGRHVAFVKADGNWPSIATAEHLSPISASRSPS